MRNLLFKIAYKGTNYHGYQIQQNAVTIAEMIHRAQEQLLGKRVDIIGCSRTDTGVHANEYYFNMLTDSKILPEKFILGFNRFLPPDIAVVACQEMPPEFHARYHSTGKQYIYKIWNSPRPNPFMQDLALHHMRPVDVDMLNEQAKALVGTHDFKCFCARKSDIEDTTRTIFDAGFTRQGDLVEFKISGDGFLYNMVRIIVGTLLQINDGQLPKDCIYDIIKGKDRKKAGKTALAHGLYLNRVFYDEKWEVSDGK